MKLFYTLCFLLCCNIVFSQQVPSVSSVNPEQNYPQNNNASSGYCALDGLRQSLAGRSGGNGYSETEMDELIYSRLQSRNGRSGPLYIPVVVHIIHNNGVENISDQMVLQGIQDMNDAFANAGSYYSPDGVDMGIRFCLALQDPNGLPTNGITRNISPLTNVTADNGQDVQLKNIVRWDPLRYVNIWLVKEITSTSMGSGVAGYAFLPNAHGTPEDGIVNEARWFGNTTDDSKVHIHEMGHYLGLYHTFEGGCTNSNCQTDGDKVCDTPPDGTSAPFACNSIPNTCTTDENDTSPNNPFRSVALGGLGDQNDLMEDFMDYGFSSCQKLFTDGQGERMRAALQSIRASLLESQVCQSSCGIGNVDIDTTDVINIAAGTLFQVGNQYTATVPVTFEWVFNGVVISTNSQLSHTFTNANIGQHYLYLYWINVADDCSLKDSILINVSCNPPASFTFSPYLIEPGVPVTFNGTNPLATTYAWYLNSQPVGSSSTFTHTFATSGPNHIYLVTGNGQCVDTSTVQYLGVGACGSGENNHWIMGGGSGNHIDFSNGTPIVSPVPNNGANPLATIEGVATISDRNGNLLFYSDGDHLYNRNHEQFFYGMGAGSSSAQGVLIVPDPGDSQSYYVFTAENFGGMAYHTGRGLSYLKVNMNGGLGGVSSQYITLLGTCGEKLSATKHCNGTDVWVVAHGFNDRKFYSYLITAAGLQAPVITEVGTSQAGNNSIGGQAIGMHKFSPDGNKLFSSTLTLYFSELFDFDNSTGIMSNPYNFPIPAHIYSAEFSPDGTKLYYAKDGSNIIYGCDISSGNAQAITSSITTVGVSSVPNYVGTFQIAPDGKIYIARNGDMFIDVIHNPNGPLTNCGFETEALRLPNASLYGLQNILVSPKYTGPQILGPANVCLGNNDVRYKVGCGDNTWEYRGHNTFSTISNKEVSINFTVAGVDTLICHRNNTCGGPGSDTLYIQVGSNFAHLGNDTSICSSGNLVLSPGSGFLSTLWSTGANTPTITVSQAGTYWVQVTGLGGCIDRDTIHVTSFNSPFDVPDAATIRICGVPNVTTHTITAAQGNFTHIWNGTQSIGNSFTANLPSAITRVPITYYNNQGCADRDTFVIEKVTTFPTVNLGNDTLICPGEVLVLNINSPERFESFRWSDGSIGESFTVYQSGTYWVQYRDTVCNRAETDVITVGYHPVPALTLPAYIPPICTNTLPYQLDAGPNYSNFVWQDGSTGRYYQVTQPGTYWVETQSVCQAVRDSATVNLVNESIYAIGFPDTITLCSNSLPYSLHASATGNLNNYQWSTGSNAGNIIVQNAGTYSLTANYVCGTVSDTTHIVVLPQPATILPANQNLCGGETSFVLHGQQNAVNTWSTGVVADSITVTQNGTYSISSVGQNGCVTLDEISISFSDLYLEEINDTLICPGQTLVITPQTNASMIFGAGGLLSGPLVITESDTGNYFLYVIEGACVKFVSFHVGLGGASGTQNLLPDSTLACSAQLPITLSAGNAPSTSYVWNTSQTSPSISVSTPGWYKVTATSGCGLNKDSTFVSISPSPTVSLPPDTVLCPGETLQLAANAQYSNLWSTGSAANSLTVSTSGTYWLKSTTSGYCFDTDTIVVQVSSLALGHIENTGFCEDGNVTVQAAVSNAQSVSWSTGQTTSSININQPGNYWVTASDGDCELTESFTVTEWPIPIFSLGNDITVPSGPVTIGVNNVFASYTWNVSGNTSNSLTVNSGGLYILTVTNGQGCSFTDSIRVHITAGIPGEDGSNVYLKIPQLLSMSQGPLMADYKGIKVNAISVYDATGKIISMKNNFPTVWDGTSSTGNVATGMYYYTLNGITESGKPFTQHGKVLLFD
jgi:hypothetical protein